VKTLPDRFIEHDIPSKQYEDSELDAKSSATMAVRDETD
jgi:hypothetical protein